MKIWIRSQDRRKLVNISGDIEIYEETDTKWKGSVYTCEPTGKWIICEDGNKLGTYSTEEKALKVLDMIQEHIENSNDKYKVYGNITEIIQFRQKVFKLPQDDEV